MEERHCPKCAEPIAADEEYCHNCGLKIPPIPAVVKSGQPVSTRVLWLAAILIIIGLVMIGTLTIYVAVSSFSDENWGTLFSATPEPGFAASASSKARRSEDAVSQAEPEALPLTELPSTADSDYILLKKELKAQRNGNEIEFVCAVQNISDVVCTGVGVEVAFYDAAKNFVGSSSSWVYRDVQPGEVIELSFEASGGENVRSYCLTEIGGEPVDGEDTAAKSGGKTDASDDIIYLTPEEIIQAKGEDPDGWVSQQAGKKFIVTGPLVEVSSSDDGQIRMAQIGYDDGVCYVFVMDPELFNVLEQMAPDTEVSMSGLCVNFDTEPQAFVLIDGVLAK